jgi:tRNA (guanine-N7-)-methyltransferase
MRLRHVTGSEQAVLQSEMVVGQPADFKGQWCTCFGNVRPIRLEIGSGKGLFLSRMGDAFPEVNYIGVERYASVLSYAVYSQNRQQNSNVRYLWMDALQLPEIFAAGEVDRIYLNFSDPWPKTKHAARRLTSPAFLSMYAALLSADGAVEQKTDNRLFFEYSLKTATACGWLASQVTYDLANSEYASDNIKTEYEEKFTRKGISINRAVYTPPTFPTP